MNIFNKMKIPFNAARRNILKAGAALPVIGPNVVSEHMNAASSGLVLENIGFAKDTERSWVLYGEDPVLKHYDKVMSRLISKISNDLTPIIFESNLKIPMRLTFLRQWRRGEQKVTETWFKSRLNVAYKIDQQNLELLMHYIDDNESKFCVTLLTDPVPRIYRNDPRLINEIFINGISISDAVLMLQGKHYIRLAKHGLLKNTVFEHLSERILAKHDAKLRQFKEKCDREYGLKADRTYIP